MALLFMDGFDHYGTGANVVKKWDSFGNNLGVNTTLKRTGIAAITLYVDNLTKILTPAGDVFIVGFALNMPVLGTANNLIRFQEGTGLTHVAIDINSSGYLVVKRNATVLATATTHIITPGSWFYLEFKVVIHDTIGSVAVRVDTIAPTFSASLTGIDTREGATGIVDRIVLNGSFTNPYGTVDDLYVCDDSGSTNNDFLGICVVETLLPQTGAGAHQDFTQSSGSDQGAMVDEATPDDDTTYNTSATVGDQESYNYPSLSLTGSILGVQTDLYARKTDAGSRTIAPIVRTASTTTPGTAVAPLTTYRYFSQVWETKPAGGAWTEADINALEVGMKVVS